MEPFKHFAKIIFGDSNPSVGDSDDGHVVGLAESHGDRLAPCRVFVGIFKKIQKYLAQSVWIGEGNPCVRSFAAGGLNQIDLAIEAAAS